MTMIPLHPKLKIAVDRLQKRYFDIKVQPAKNASKHTYKTESGSQSSEEVYTAIDVFANTSKNEFAHMYMSGYGQDFKEHEFYLKTRLVSNQRYPRDEKTVLLASNGCTQLDYILSANLAAFVMQKVDEDASWYIATLIQVNCASM